jgi:hypothetical protein
MVSHHASERPRRPARADEHLLCPRLPPPGRHPAPRPAPVSARWPGGTAAGRRPRRPWLRSNLMRARHGQLRTIPFWSRPMQAGDHAARRPRHHVDALRPAGAAATPSHSGSSARTGRRQRRGHRSVSVRTPDAPDTWTPDTWALDVRSTVAGRPHGGPDEADRATTGQADIRTSSRPATPAERPDLAGSRRLGPLGQP